MRGGLGPHVHAWKLYCGESLADYSHHFDLRGPVMGTIYVVQYTQDIIDQAGIPQDTAYVCRRGDYLSSTSIFKATGINTRQYCNKLKL